MTCAACGWMATMSRLVNRCCRYRYPASEAGDNDQRQQHDEQLDAHRGDLIGNLGGRLGFVHGVENFIDGRRPCPARPPGFFVSSGLGDFWL